MLELTIRLVVSLAFVLGLLLLIARISSRRFRGSRDSMVRVLHRQQLTRSSAVSVVSVGSRVLVLGTTEQQVSVLAELDPEDVADAEVVQLAAVPGAHRADVPAVRPAAPGARRAESPLAGSVLSADTWRQALTAATRRSS